MPYSAAGGEDIGIACRERLSEREGLRKTEGLCFQSGIGNIIYKQYTSTKYPLRLYITC